MVKIVALSDIHGHLPAIPECDLLIIAGDICPTSNHSRPFQADWLMGIFNPWIKNVPAKNKVIIAGNHDFVFEDRPYNFSPSKLNCIYLENFSVEIDGIKIWGSPFSRWFYSWAFNAPETDNEEVFLDKLYSKIPQDTDIIISHGPPIGYGDITLEGTRTGSIKLLEHFKRTSAKLLLVGHIHEDRGIFELDKNKTIVNCSYLDRGYSPYENYAFQIDFEKSKGIIDIQEI
jgi:Icc-related predicted phosphoesterase